MFATDINHNTTVSHSVDRGDPLDRRLAEQRLADGATPWEVMGQHLAKEGAFTFDAVSWLVENGGVHHDIGRFARRCGVLDESIKKMQDSLTEKEGDNLAWATSSRTRLVHYPKRSRSSRSGTGSSYRPAIPIPQAWPAGPGES